MLRGLFVSCLINICETGRMNCELTGENGENANGKEKHSSLFVCFLILEKSWLTK